MVFTAYPQKDEDQQLARVVISKGGKLSSVVDLATPSPDGGTFVKFGAGSAPGLAGDSVAFPAETSAGKAGWWLAPLASGASAAGTVSKIVDNSTAMPIAGDHTFKRFDGSAHRHPSRSQPADRMVADRVASARAAG